LHIVQIVFSLISSVVEKSFRRCARFERMPEDTMKFLLYELSALIFAINHKACSISNSSAYRRKSTKNIKFLSFEINSQADLEKLVRFIKIQELSNYKYKNTKILLFLKLK
jgi:hypothetical protein